MAQYTLIHVVTDIQDWCLENDYITIVFILIASAYDIEHTS